MYRKFKREVSKRLSAIGKNVTVQYVVIVNNDAPAYFTSYEDAQKYLFQFRETSAIFNLSINRIEIYSL